MAGQGVQTIKIEVDVVAYGRPATEALAHRISAAKAGGHPLDPVTVIVPSNTAGLSARRLLTTGDPSTALAPVNLANVSFVTPFRLAELLAAGSMGDRRPLTTPVLAAAVRSALAAAPGYLAEAADHHATQRAVISLYSELSRAHPETLAAISAASTRGAEVVQLVEQVARRLTAFFDEDDVAAAATARLRADPAATARPLGAVIWHLPDRLTPAMAELLRHTLTAATGASAVVALTGAPPADAPVVDTLALVGVSLTDVQVQAVPEPPTAQTFTSASDPDEEVRDVVRQVLALAEQDGIALDRMAIFRPSSGPYHRTLLEHLDGAGIPHNGPATARLADSVAGRTLLNALALPARGWGRGDVMSLVASAPVRDDKGLVSSTRWDSVSRRAGVVAGLEQWRTKLPVRAAELTKAHAEVEAEDPDNEARLAAIARDIDAMDSLLQMVETLAARLDLVAAEATWAGKAAAASDLLVEILGPEHRRLAWPDHEADAAARVDEALTRLAALDELDPEPTAEAFELAVAAELDRATGRAGAFGHGVLVSPLSAAAGHDLDAVFVLGMAEGSCPWFRRDDALLPDSDRQRAVAGELGTAADRLADQHRSYLAALAAGGLHRRLLFPRGDLRSRRERLPSRWLLDTASALVGRPVFSSDVAHLAPPHHRQVASFEDGVTHAQAYASHDDRDVAALLAHTAGGGDPSSHPLCSGQLGRGFATRAARQSAAFTEWDGNLSGQQIPSPATGVPLSPTSLQSWAKCPFSYFLGQVLRLREREDPERIVEIGAADRGTLVHDILESFIAEVIARPSGPPTPDQAWTDSEAARLRAIAHDAFAACESRGITGRPLHWSRVQAQVLADLDTFLVKDSEHRATRQVTPARVEMSFGVDGTPPLTITLPSGRVLAFKGRADRVDASDDGRLVVFDYKTGKGDEYAALGEDPVLAGTTLQLGVYAEAALAQVGGKEAEAYYWMATERGKFRVEGYHWTDERRSRFLDVAEAIVDGIESGTFPARPGEYDSFFGSHENCGFCDFNRVCPRDRDDHERAKAGAPELAVLERLLLDIEEDPT